MMQYKLLPIEPMTTRGALLIQLITHDAEQNVFIWTEEKGKREDKNTIKVGVLDFDIGEARYQDLIRPPRDSFESLCCLGSVYDQFKWV